MKWTSVKYLNNLIAKFEKSCIVFAQVKEYIL